MAAFSDATNPKLDELLRGMPKPKRVALLNKLVREHAPDTAREYGGERTKRTEVLAILRAFPRSSYSAISVLIFGDADIGNRLKVAGHAAQLAKAGKLRKVPDERGAWDPVEIAKPKKKT